MPKWAIALLVAGPLLTIAIATTIILKAAAPKAVVVTADASQSPSRPDYSVTPASTRATATVNAPPAAATATAVNASNQDKIDRLAAENERLRTALAVGQLPTPTTLPADAPSAQQSPGPLTIDVVNAFATRFTTALEDHQRADAHAVLEATRLAGIQTALDSLRSANMKPATKAILQSGLEKLRAADIWTAAQADAQAALLDLLRDTQPEDHKPLADPKLDKLRADVDAAADKFHAADNDADAHADMQLFLGKLGTLAQAVSDRLRVTNADSSAKAQAQKATETLRADAQAAAEKLRTDAQEDEAADMQAAWEKLTSDTQTAEEAVQKLSDEATK